MPIPSPGQNGGSKRILTPNTTSVALRDIRFTIDPKLVGAIGLEPMKPEGGRFTVFCSCRCAILPDRPAGFIYPSSVVHPQVEV